MAATSRFFIIRPDGTTSTVTSDQLAAMRQSGFVGPDDKVIPIPQQGPSQTKSRIIAPSMTPMQNQALTRQIIPAVDDIDTAPLAFFAEAAIKPGAPAAHIRDSGFGNLEDSEIDQAFSNAISRSLYQLEAKRVGDNLSLVDGETIAEANKSLLDGRPLYNIRFKDGRVLGPFDQPQIWEHFAQNAMTGDEEIALAGSEDFKPLQNHATFKAATKVFKSAATAATQTLTPVALVAQLLNLAHQMATGWLIIKSGSTTQVVSFAIGRLLNIRSNRGDSHSAESELTDLFGWEKGTFGFESDSSAASDTNILQEDTIALCRRLTSVEGGFPLARTLHLLGEQTRVLQAKPSSAWLVAKDALSPIEHQILERAEQGKTLHTTRHELLAFGASEEEAAHALLMTSAMGAIGFLSEEALQKIKSFAAQLESDDAIALLDITSESPEAQVLTAIETLRNRVWQASQQLSLKDPLRQRMRERFGQLTDGLFDPLERYILLRSRELGPGPRDDFELRTQLKIEFLNQVVSKGIAEKKYLEILPYAETFHALAPERLESHAWVLLARYFSAANSDRDPMVLSIKKALKRQPKEPTILLAATTIFLDQADFKNAKRVIGRLEKILIEDERVLAFKAELHRAESVVATVHETRPVAFVHVLWSTFVTLAMTGLLWLLAIDLELGKSEVLDREVDEFLWIRGGVLVAFTLLGYGILYREGIGSFFKRLSFKLTPMALIISILAGAGLGTLLSEHSVVHRELGALPLGAMLGVVLVDRLYFTGFFAQDVLRTLSSRIVGILLVSGLYTLYYVSFYEVLQTPIEDMALRFIAIGLGLSLPLAILQFGFRSALPPILFHLSFALASYSAFHAVSGALAV